MKTRHATKISAPTLSALAILTSLNLPAHANTEQAQLKQQIDNAISRFEQTPRKQWAYQVSNYENEEGNITSSIERYDPALETSQHWQLLEINGEEPSQKQLEKFYQRKNKAKQKKDKNKEEQSFSFQLRDMIVIDSLQLVSEDDNDLKASFEVELERLGEKASKKLQGVLTYSKQDEYIQHLAINNTDSFSPVFSADIKEFSISFHFGKMNDAILPQKYEMNMKGSFAFFTEIDEVSTTTFSNYRFVAD